VSIFAASLKQSRSALIEYLSSPPTSTWCRALVTTGYRDCGPGDREQGRDRARSACRTRRNSIPAISGSPFRIRVFAAIRRNASEAEWRRGARNPAPRRRVAKPSTAKRPKSGPQKLASRKAARCSTRSYGFIECGGGACGANGSSRYGSRIKPISHVTLERRGTWSPFRPYRTTESEPAPIFGHGEAVNDVLSMLGGHGVSLPRPAGERVGAGVTDDSVRTTEPPLIPPFSPQGDRRRVKRQGTPDEAQHMPIDKNIRLI